MPQAGIDGDEGGDGDEVTKVPRHRGGFGTGDSSLPVPWTDVITEASPAPDAAGAASNPSLIENVAVEDQGKLTPWEEEREWASTSPAELVQIEEDLRGMHAGSTSTAVAAVAATKAETAVPEAGSFDSLKGNKALTDGNDGCLRESDECVSPSANGSLVAARVPLSDDERESAVLPALERELAAIPDGEKMAYLEARRKCPELVDNEHKKAFIWRMDYDPVLAARRLVRHWQFKRKLFGPAKCFLPMTLSSAMSDDVAALSSGLLQLLPVKDEYGRTILFVTACRLDWTKYSREGMMRVLWYLLHVASADPVERRRGVVTVFNSLSVAFKHVDVTFYRPLFAIPLKYHMALGRSIHHCHPGYFFHVIAPIFKMLVGERLRKRLRVHYGSIDDVLRSLSDFGLGRDRVPKEMGGTLRVDISRWLSDRMTAEGAWTTCRGGGSLAWSKASAGGGKIECGFDLDRDKDNIDSILAPMLGEKQYREATERLSVRIPDPTQVGGSLLNGAPSPIITNTNDDGVSAVASPKGLSCSSPQHVREQLPGLSFNGAPETRASHSGKIEPSPPFPTEASVGFQDTRSVLPTSRNDPAAPSDLLGKVHIPKKKAKEWRDPRMARAVQAKVDNPKMSLLDALITGGFDYPRTKPKGHTDKNIRDSEGVLLFQRKNNLCRRLREMRNCEGDAATGKNRARRVSVSKPVAKPPKISGKKEVRVVGDHRMTRALEAKASCPSMSLLDALIEGGFNFPASRLKGENDRTIIDEEGVMLFQRKNQLCRRLREKRSDDPRIRLAVAAKQKDPGLSLVEALLAGGFQFPQLGTAPDDCDKKILDTDKVSLFTWKKELRKKLTAWERSSCDKKTMHRLVSMGCSDEAIANPAKLEKGGCKDQSSLIKKQQITAHHESISHKKGKSDVLLACRDDKSDNQCSHHEGVKKSTSFEKDINELPGLDELPEGDNWDNLSVVDSFTIGSCFGGSEGMN